MTSIFKVCEAPEWREAESRGSYEGSADDRRDGFIHFSTLTQLAGTLTKHFPDRDDLVLVAVKAEALGGALKWEPSRGGDQFPHLYGALPISAVLWVRPLLRDEYGGYLLPPEAGT